MSQEHIKKLLEHEKSAAPAEIQTYFSLFEKYYSQRLWHQLTELLLEFYHKPESAPVRINIYKEFVLSFSTKINQLKLVTIGLSAASCYKNDKERLAFLTDLAKKVDTLTSQDAFVYATVEVARVKLQLNDVEGARKELDRSEKILDSFDSVENVVHASFYRVNADYFQAKSEYASYYKNALLYLACISDSDLSPEERKSRAYNLSVAALVSETIYNFGELLLHPILDSLKSGENAWLRELLFAFNRGDLANYDALAANISKNKLLKEHSEFLYEKIRLSALTEAVFRRPPHDRAMKFSTISQETRVPPNDIEHLIMRALSLGLLKGSIDQVTEVARINWVQPKVLDKTQIGNMRARLLEWDSGVNQLGTWIEGVGQDVWAA